MTDPNDGLDRESRRSFIRKGALGSGGLALGLGSTPAAAQNGGNESAGTAGGSESDAGATQGLMYHHEFHPGAQFRVTSPSLQASPDPDSEISGANLGTYRMRFIEYANTNEQAQLFVPQNVSVEQGEVYELARIDAAFQESPSTGLVSIQFEPVAQGDSQFDDDGNPGWESGQDFEIINGGGNALITGYRFYPGALFRITSGVVERAPRPEIQDVANLTTYNTRLAEYLGTNMNFVFYPAGPADVEQGAVYVMRQDAEDVDPEGRFRSVNFSRVNEDDLDESLLQS